MKLRFSEILLLGAVIVSALDPPYVLYRSWRHLDHEGKLVDRWCEYRGLQGERTITIPPDRLADSCVIIRFFPFGTRSGQQTQ